MFCMMKFDNCKKLSKVTRLSKRLISLVDNFGFDVGYYEHDLVIAQDAHNILKAHADIHRTSWGRIAVHKWRGTVHEATWYDYNSQAEAFFDALAWVNSRA